MLDTMTLVLQEHAFEIREPDLFSPSAAGLLHAPHYALGKNGRFSCVQNPTKKEQVYKPRLTLTRKRLTNGYSTTLRIEFSAPKLLHGN